MRSQTATLLEHYSPFQPGSRLERLLLVHYWLCVPFGALWVLWPHTFGRTRDVVEIAAMRHFYIIVFITLCLRTYLSYRKVSWRGWLYIWPVIDAGFITAASVIAYTEPDSWIVVLYILPILQAAATLDLRWALTVAVLSAVFCGGAVGFSDFQHVYFAFRLFFLILMASLFTRLVREIAKGRQELAVSQYRNEMSVEMHDGLQQYLGAISMRLEFARSWLSKDPAKAAEIAIEQQEVARQASDELRMMVRRMRTPLLGQGLVEALRYLCSLSAQRLDIPVDLDTPAELPSMPAPTEHAALRIVQEALNNAAKYAQAHRIEVKVRATGSSVGIEIRDDGVGYDPKIATGDKGIGLQTMRERAEAVGGSLKIETALGKGTCVQVQVPLA
ncbi:MAG: sensor histidine kinase [Fimbriimonadaceae bacterium]|nr:sensor histidine kinase [Fimbriimonadaceae bacterium]